MELVCNKTTSDREKIWNAMRIETTFDFNTLQQLTGAKKANIYLFMRVLKKGNYVRKKGKKRYRLIKNTGPLHPVISLEYGILKDRNTGEHIHVK